MSIKSILKPVFGLLLTSALIIVIFGSHSSASAALGAGTADFLITVNTMNPGTSTSFQFTIPTIGSEYNFNIDCNNDGTNESKGHKGSYTCNYKIPETYTIRISDNTGAGLGFPRISFNNGGDMQKLLSVDQWGTGKWASMAGAFDGCMFMTLNATDASELFYVADMSWMFAGASAFNADISGWNMHTVTTAANMFNGAKLSTANYDALLKGWDAQALQHGVSFDGGSSTYCTGATARADMISHYGWTITDGGDSCLINNYLPLIVKN